jgi:ubiquinone/menaquinone biosynthesis C-methylase UbiE
VKRLSSAREGPADPPGEVQLESAQRAISSPEGRDPYRAVARWYDRLFERSNHELRVIGLEMFPPKPGMAVLDVGCGTGAQLALYRRFHCRLFGIDTSPSMLGIARARLGDAADLRRGSAIDLPYATGQFDLVISMLCLHEMRPQIRSKAVESMKRVLREEGRILLIDHYTGPIQSFRGWLTKTLVPFVEAAAGREHFRNYRQFVASGGLPPLAAEQSLTPTETRAVHGSALVLMLLKKET